MPITLWLWGVAGASSSLFFPGRVAKSHPFFPHPFVNHFLLIKNEATPKRKRCSAVSCFRHVVQLHQLISENLFLARLMLKKIRSETTRFSSDHHDRDVLEAGSGSIFGNNNIYFCDGMGLRSPGRWHPRLRQVGRTAQQRSYCEMLGKFD